MNKYDICFVILNYNSSKDTLALLSDLTKQLNVTIKCVVVDNCSSYDDFTFLEESITTHYPNVDLLCCRSNQGYANGNNFGFFYAFKRYQFNYLSIINPDIRIKENDFLSLFFEKLNHLESVTSEKVALSGCKIKGNKHSGWNFPKLSDDLWDLTYIGSRVKKIFVKKDSSLPHKTLGDAKFYDVISGCFFVVKPNYFFEVNGFDNFTFLYCEERLLARKFNELGFTNVIFDSLQITHKNGSSINASFGNKQKVKILIKSRSYYHLKYSDNPSVFYFSSRALFFLRGVEEFLISKYRKCCKR